MESLNPWLLLVAGLLVGALIGGIGILFMERRNRGSAEDVRAARRELEEYRQEVAEHYVETAKRVNALTHSYKSVYDHLEDGAYRLVGEDELRRRLDDRGAEPVMLEGIGQRSLQRPDDGPVGEARDTDAGDRDAAAGADARRRDGTAGADVLPSTGTAAGHAGTSAGHVAAYPTVNDSITDDVAEERAATTRREGDAPASGARAADGADALRDATIAPADERPREGYAVETTADPGTTSTPAAVPEGDDATGERVTSDAEDEVRRG